MPEISLVSIFQALCQQLHYDPLSFGNSMVDMLLYIRQENQRLEEHLGDALYARQQNREEAA